MIPHDELHALNQAISQGDRLRAAPSPTHVKVDGRSVAELLGFAAEYGTLIRYYDLTDTPDGDWSAFFQDDPSIALALRAGLDIPDIEARLDAALQEMRSARTFETRLELLRRVTTAILRLVRILELGQVRPLSLEQALQHLMASGRRDLVAAPAQRLVVHLGGHAPEHGLRHGLEGIASEWFHLLIEFLEDLVAALTTALAQERSASLAALEASFHDQAHPPQSGLWDAFVQLFGHAQQSINEFPRRLLRFYQDSVLRQDCHAGRADQLILAFTPAKGLAQVTLPKGTEFSAGTAGDGESIAYALDSALTVDATSVAALRTVTVSSQAPVAGAARAPAQVLSGTVALSATPPAIAAPFPLFGATSVGTQGSLTSVKASLGFAVASPCLMLAGGARVVSLGLGVSPGSLAAMAPLLDALGPEAGGLGSPALLAQLLQGAFSLRYSTAGGWVDISGYTVAPPTDEGGPFVLSFTLGPDADALVALATEPPAADAMPAVPASAVPDTGTPTLLASLLQDPVALGTGGSSVEVYPYAVLSEMLLTSLSIAVDVTGLADLQVASPAGPVDASQPFALFGTPPVRNAALELGAPELFAKQLDSFQLSIDWFGLPVTSTGFYGYYKAYIVDANGDTVPPGSLFDNLSFTAHLDVVNPGRWDLDAQSRNLFQTDPDVSPPGTAPLLPQTLLDAAVSAHQPGAYYDPAMSSVRLSLDQPSYAFGNVLYAANVMAASVQLTAAASACAQKCSRPGWLASASAQLEPIATAGATGSDSDLDERIRAAVQAAVSGLDADAANALRAGIAGSDVSTAQKSNWTDSLAAALGQPGSASWLQRIRPFGKPASDFASTHARLQQWLSEHSAELSTHTPAAVDQAATLLAAGTGALDVQARVAGQPASVARPLASAGVRSAQASLEDAGGRSSQKCIQDCLAGCDSSGFPNQPWLPMAAGISVDYTAATTLPATTGSAAQASFFHLLPFDQVEAVDWPAGGSVPLLVPVPQAGSLYLELSGTADSLALLFRLAPSASGWPAETPPLSWAQATGASTWTSLTPDSDSTHGMKNSGIVRLAAAASPTGEPTCLRLSVAGDTTCFPELAGLATNAATATWVGPGGAADLGLPLPAGTVTKAVAALPALGSVEQPLPSSGGRPAATGPAFDLWLAERLRHKDRGIQSWDYANLVLEGFPSLWQVAVVPASDGSGKPAPGQVWIVPVPGPRTPAIADPTIPSNDAETLEQVSTFLASRISPFIRLAVTNPPYRRLKVVARLMFTDDDAIQACITRLNQELIDFLSPWPPQALGPRPHDYYTRKEVAHFVRHRPYVRGILSLKLVPEAPLHGTPAGHHCYLTSALAHDLSGKAAPDPQALARPGDALARLALTTNGDEA